MRFATFKLNVYVFFDPNNSLIFLQYEDIINPDRNLSRFD